MYTYLVTAILDRNWYMQKFGKIISDDFLLSNYDDNIAFQDKHMIPKNIMSVSQVVDKRPINSPIQGRCY